MDKTERIKMIKAMEYIARQINDESVFCDIWLSEGVADGDIEYGDLSVNSEDFDNLEDYCEDDNFADLMGTFILCMRHAYKSGGLYCDDVVDNYSK